MKVCGGGGGGGEIPGGNDGVRRMIRVMRGEMEILVGNVLLS